MMSNTTRTNIHPECVCERCSAYSEYKLGCNHFDPKKTHFNAHMPPFLTLSYTINNLAADWETKTANIPLVLGKYDGIPDH